MPLGNKNDGTRHRAARQANERQTQEEPQRPHHQGWAEDAISFRTATKSRTRHPRRRCQSQLAENMYSFSKLLCLSILGFILVRVVQPLVGLPLPSSVPETSTRAWTQGGDSPAPPRVLVGIFSTDSLLESKRRQVIRKTYLSYYTNSTGTSTPNNRICSLSEFLHKTTIMSRHGDHHLLGTRECQLIYAFVLGTNTSRTANVSTIHHASRDGTKNTGYNDFDDFNLVEPFVRGELDTSELGRIVNVSSSWLSNVDPNESFPNDDLVLLNISENMNQGKSESWFLYATQLWKRHMNMMNNKRMDDKGAYASPTSIQQQLLLQPIDYIAKCDSDTLLFPEILLDQLLEHLPSHPQNAYFAGSRNSRIGPKGPFSYLMGGCYLLSWELSNYVTSLDCNRTKLYLGPEDASMANYIWSFTNWTYNTEHATNTEHHQKSIQTINVLAKGVEWMRHGTKDPMQLQKLWNRRYDGTTTITRHNSIN
jgi:hypothetical protein